MIKWAGKISNTKKKNTSNANIQIYLQWQAHRSKRKNKMKAFQSRAFGAFSPSFRLSSYAACHSNGFNRINCFVLFVLLLLLNSNVCFIFVPIHLYGVHREISALASTSTGEKKSRKYFLVLCPQVRYKCGKATISVELLIWERYCFESVLLFALCVRNFLRIH